MKQHNDEGRFLSKSKKVRLVSAKVDTEAYNDNQDKK